MTHRDLLAPLLDDVREHVHSQLEAGGRVRDFAAMIARARAIEPAAVSDAALAEVADYAPVVVLRRPTPRPSPASPRTSPARAAWLGAALAAAVLLGLLGSAELLRQATRTGATPCRTSDRPRCRTRSAPHRQSPAASSRPRAIFTCPKRQVPRLLTCPQDQTPRSPRQRPRREGPSRAPRANRPAPSSIASRARPGAAASSTRPGDCSRG